MSRPFVFAPRVAFSALAALMVVGICAPRVALANGAFPESFQLLVPADRPKQIVLATNFGLILSDDDGATWNWTCEMEQTINGALYAVGAPPMDRFFALSSLMGFAYSDDDSCSWKIATGSLDRVLATDFFPDQTVPEHVLAIGEDPGGATGPQIFASMDGGASFGDSIYQAPTTETLTGLEIARSDSKTIYLAAYDTPGIHPKLIRSTDGGANWTPIDVEAALGPNNFRIIAVDPADPKTITLRVIESLGESVAISHDGGDTFRKAFTLDGGQLTAYAKLGSGTVLVAGKVLDQARGFRSTDGGLTFQDWKVPHLVALAVRGNKLYAAAKNYSDDWAVGVSIDEGLTFKPLTRYDQVRSIRPCAQAVCLDSCKYQVSQQVWGKAVCTPAPDGCGCGISPRPTAGLAAVALAGFLLAARRRRGRR